jgi:hypothetical protein
VAPVAPVALGGFERTSSIQRLRTLISSRLLEPYHELIISVRARSSAQAGHSHALDITPASSGPLSDPESFHSSNLGGHE